MGEITYLDRYSKKRCIEKVYGQQFLAFLYRKSLFSKILLHLVAKSAFISRLYGYLQKRPNSQKKIAPFIKEFGVDTEEFATQKFRSFNDFFTRKLKSEARPVKPGIQVAVMPADGRYLVFPRIDKMAKFYVKGQTLSVGKLLRDQALAKRFEEGSMVFARLCPVDYHRFHFPVDSVPSKPKLINGALYSVNPIALRQNLGILRENKRFITQLETEEFGDVLFIEVGATNVGSVVQTYEPFQKVQKGDEKGYFEFGGSSIILLFEKDRITFDDDLVESSKEGIEVLAKFGDSLGLAQPLAERADR